ncbi:GCN5-like N-acetyltransferase [Rhizodiscina lignyota]|uniref:GCN5-like N-acetyltransferase n=1 Tax=Rhizodiscina lignyota TaxID=1504668 RepID=A0A9P4I2B6_9PEZI|nr:GCN5-like N-acetyltransferase [Rhizodiscina lignyota]
MAPTLSEGYEINTSPPSVQDYLALRQSSPTLTPINPSQAEAALHGSWHTIHITHQSDPSHAVAMGRIIGDGGWFFSIGDIVVLPSHQRKGLGDFIMSTLMEEIKKRAPKGAPGAYVMLFAAPGARGLYARYGFRDTMPGNMGMAQWLEKD